MPRKSNGWTGIFFPVHVKQEFDKFQIELIARTGKKLTAGTAMLEMIKLLREQDNPCDHCGSQDNVRTIDLVEALRRLCARCRNETLEWI